MQDVTLAGRYVANVITNKFLHWWMCPAIIQQEYSLAWLWQSLFSDVSLTACTKQLNKRSWKSSAVIHALP